MKYPEIIRNCTVILMIALALAACGSAPACAKNAIITVSSTHGYGEPFSLLPGTKNALEKLGPVNETSSLDEIQGILAQLSDGDVLILNLHSNALVFGYGEKKSKPWHQFYKHFKIEKLPRLALVIIHGCIYTTDENKNEVSATDGEIQNIRECLNANAIICFNHTVQPLVGRDSVDRVVKGMVENKEIKKLIVNPTLKFLVHSKVDKLGLPLRISDLQDMCRKGIEGLWFGNDFVLRFTKEDSLIICRVRKPPNGWKGYEKEKKTLFIGTETSPVKYEGEWWYYPQPGECPDLAKDPAKRKCTITLSRENRILTLVSNRAEYIEPSILDFSSEARWDSAPGKRYEEIWLKITGEGLIEVK